MSDNYYEELGVDPGASRDEIRDAHRTRISELEAARGKKGVSDAQMQANRVETARVRSAWNVLSDPFQRKRYDEKLATPSAENGGVELVDEEGDGDGDEPTTQLTGWRKLMAPAPAAGGGKGKGGKTPAKRPLPEPTVQLPAGMQLAEPRARSMALLFDFTILFVLYIGVNLFLPGLIQSDYKDISKQIDKVNTVHDAQVSIDDATSSLKSAKTNADKASAEKDRNSARRDFKKAAKDAHSAGVASTPHDAKTLQKQADKLSAKIRTTQLITVLIVIVASLLYLVPMTAITGRTWGMRNRRLKVVRVDGSPVGWYAAFTRFLIPVLIGLAIPPPIGPVLGFGLVLWGYRDRNRQGVHDKLARTLVVAA